MACYIIKNLCDIIWVTVPSSWLGSSSFAKWRSYPSSGWPGPLWALTLAYSITLREVEALFPKKRQCCYGTSSVLECPSCTMESRDNMGWFWPLLRRHMLAQSGPWHHLPGREVIKGLCEANNAWIQLNLTWKYLQYIQNAELSNMQAS